MGLRNYSNTTPVVTLTTGVNDTDTTIYLSNGSDVFPSAPFTMLLDYGTVNEEVVEVTSKTAYNEFVVTRGADSSVAVAHSSGAEAVHGVSARDLSEPNAHVNATTSVHGIADTADLATMAYTDIAVATANLVTDSSGSRTLGASDKGKTILLSHATANAVTLPSATFAAGDRIDFVQTGAGATTFAGSGVTVSSKDSLLGLTGQYSAATVIFTSASAALLVGDLA